jgi:hypothetical protein
MVDVSVSARFEQRWINTCQSEILYGDIEHLFTVCFCGKSCSFLKGCFILSSHNSKTAGG